MTTPAYLRHHATWSGRLFPPGQSRAIPVTIRSDGVGMTLEGPGLERPRTHPGASVAVTPPIGGGDYWRFDLPTGEALEVIDGGALAATLGHAPSLLTRLEASWRLALLAVPVMLGLAAASWFWGVPYVADRVADHIPPWVEQRITQTTLDLIFHDKTPTHVPPARQKALTAILATMARPDDPEHLTLHFLDAPAIGPNAFALPGGDIIVTDQLIRDLTDDEVAAVLAHEVGHVRHRHGLRLALRASGLSVLTALTLGDASSAGHFLVAAPTLLLNLEFTRDFETEADTAALDWLSQPGRSPCTFASALRKIANSPEVKAMAKVSGKVPGWLATHPLTDQRLRRFDNACHKRP